MKKFLTALLCAITAVVAVIGFTACGNTDGISVYMPDGAPALAMAKLMSENEDFGKKVNYHVVQAGEINSFVTYKKESKNADLCILPVNAASKLLGDGAKYKVLGTVTHGNLFILSNTDKEEVTSENVEETLKGKKVGVVNFAAFPGAATKLVLNKYGILEDVELSEVNATQVIGTNNDFDYFVMPEPAASTKIANANLGLKFAGNLQTLYGEGGYPQAVLVAKNSLIEGEPEFIGQFTAAMVESASWLLQESTSAETIFNAVKNHYPDPENTDPAFKVNNLTKSVIANCAISFEYAADCKEQIKTFLNELIAVKDSTATEVSDDFFYIGTAI